MRSEYDFRGGIRGKYAARFARDATVVVLDPDIAERFPDSRLVNDELRALTAIGDRKKRRRPAQRTAKKGARGSSR